MKAAFKRALVVRVFVVLLLVSMLVCPWTARAMAQVGAAGKGSVTAALDRRGDFHFERMHLQDIVQSLREQFKIDIRIDKKALDDVGVDSDKELAIKSFQERKKDFAKKMASQLNSMGLRIAANDDLFKQIRELQYPGLSFEISDVSLRSALHHFLHELDDSVTIAVQDDILWITTKEGAERNLQVHVYVVDDLAHASPLHIPAESPFESLPQAGTPSEYDFEPLRQILFGTIAPDSWDEAGGPGSIRDGNGSLTVSQTSEMHEEIEALLAALRNVRAKAKQPELGYEPIAVSVSAPAAQREEMITAALEKRADFELQNATLAQMIKFIEKNYKIHVQLDQASLEKVGVSDDTPISLHQRNSTLRGVLESLSRLITPTLTFTIDHEVLLITTHEGACERPKVVIYPVRDLVIAAMTAPDAENRPDLWDFQPLMDNIKGSINSEGWDDAGGVGSISVDSVAGALVISQTDAVHHEIVGLLGELRRVALARPKVKRPPAEVQRDADPYVTVVFRLWQPYKEQAVVKEADLVKVIQEMVAPKSWHGEEVFVRVLPSRLIIRQRASVQRMIYAALQRLSVLKPDDESDKTGKPDQPAKPNKPEKGNKGFGGGAFGGGTFGGGQGGFGGFQGAGQLPGVGN
ncbi:MAG: hypothetical protein K8T25_10745 [Planctomycetia bacterium]|nr:hypothetical protein [Planctomycetia bacterium]